MDAMRCLKIMAVLMISVLFINCGRDNKSENHAQFMEQGGENDDPQIKIGPYVLNLILSAKASFIYDIRIIDPVSEKIMARTQASLSTRPLPYSYAADYLALPVDANQGETDSVGNTAFKAFLVFNGADGRFKRYGVALPSADNFCVIDNTLYVGNHLDESPNGAVTMIDLPTGKTAYIYLVKAGNECKAIETWAPVVGINDRGEVVVRLNEYDNKLYRIENDCLVFYQNGGIQPPANPVIMLP